MANDKKPSIYSDRSTIGSSDELDEYGVWVKSEPRNLSPADTEAAVSSLPDFDTGIDDETVDSGFGDLELPDLDIPDESTEDSEQAKSDDFDSYKSDTLDTLSDTSLEDASFDDFSIPEDAAPSAESDEVSFDSTGFSEVSIEDFLDDKPASQSSGDTTELGTLEWEDDEAEIQGAVPEELQPETPSHAQADMSTQLLMKIADELSSIRTELSGLKKEFAVIRADHPEEEKTEVQHGGFFNEEEDEKIALTGDELDNILNTADFTEEAGEDAIDETGSDTAETVEEKTEDAFEFPEAEDDLSSTPFQVEIPDEAEIPDEEEIPAAEETLAAEEFPVTEETLNAEEISAIEESVTIEETAIMPESPADSADEFDLLSDQADIISIDEEIDLGEESNASDQTDDFIQPFAIDDEDTVHTETETADVTGFDANSSLDHVIADNEDIDADIAAFDDALDSEELRQLRSDGATPMTQAPDDTSYLEEDPLADEPEIDDDSTITLDDIDLDAGSFEIEIEEKEPAIPEPEETSVIENTEALEETPPEIPAELSLEEPLEISAELEEPAELPAEEATEELTDFTFDESSIDLSDAIIDEPDLSSDISEATPEEPSLDIDDNLDQVIPEGFSVDSNETPVTFDDDFDLEEVDELESIDFPSAGEAETEDQSASGEPAGRINEAETASSDTQNGIPSGIKNELKVVLSYMDQLLESLPEEKIEEFAKSEYFDTYKKLFKELGLA